MHPCHGGARSGAGRKQLYGEPTQTVRVPQSQLGVVSAYLQTLRVEPGNPSRLLTTSRAVSPLPSATVPLLGRPVRAGSPASGDDHVSDMVELGSHLVRDPQSTFVMKVKGWSMRDVPIHDGDEIVVDTALVPENGRIVVAEVDGELTVKRLVRTRGGWLLQAANPEFQDVMVKRKSELRIWGVVTCVLHRV